MTVEKDKASGLTLEFYVIKLEKVNITSTITLQKFIILMM